jgi:arylsulfatase A-like enzyme
LYWHYPLPKVHWLGGRSCGAIRKGDWKLLEFFDDGHLELYNLKDDRGERDNLAGELPQKTAELHALLKNWRTSINAILPSQSNP